MSKSKNAAKSVKSSKNAAKRLTTAEKAERTKNAAIAAKSHANAAHNASDNAKSNARKYAKQHAKLIAATAAKNNFERDVFNTRLHTKCAVINAMILKDRSKSVSVSEVVEQTHLVRSLVANHFRSLVETHCVCERTAKASVRFAREYNSAKAIAMRAENVKNAETSRS